MSENHNPELGIQESTGFNTDEPKTGAIAFFAVLSIIILIGSVLLVQYYVDRTKETQTYQKVLTSNNEDLKVLRDKENQQMGSYGYVDQAKGVTRIPIEKAMQALADEAAAGKQSYAASSYPVKVAQPNAADGGSATKSPTAAPGAAPAAPGAAPAAGTAAPAPAAAPVGPGAGAPPAHP